RPGIDRAERAEVLLESCDVELPDTVCDRQVLEPVLAEIAQGDAVWQVAGDERARRIGQQHLAAVSGRGDPRRTMDVEADVVVTAESALAGMEAHPHADDRRLRPRHRGEPTLRLGGCRDRIECGA